jgi:hypothetical protein
MDAAKDIHKEMLPIVLLCSGDSFPHLIQKRRSKLGFVTYLLNYPRTSDNSRTEISTESFTARY